MQSATPLEAIDPLLEFQMDGGNDAARDPIIMSTLSTILAQQARQADAMANQASHIRQLDVRMRRNVGSTGTADLSARERFVQTKRRARRGCAMPLGGLTMQSVDQDVQTHGANNPEQIIIEPDADVDADVEYLDQPRSVLSAGARTAKKSSR